MALNPDYTNLQAMIASLTQQRDANGGANADPIFDQLIAEYGAQLQTPGGPDPMAGLARYSGLTDIDKFGANTGTLNGNRVNYYVKGNNVGEYDWSQSLPGQIQSRSSSQDWNYMQPEGFADDRFFITSANNKPTFQAPAPADSTLGNWMEMAPVLAGPLMGATGFSSFLTSQLGQVGGAAAGGAISSALGGGNPLMGALMGGVKGAFTGAPAITESMETLNSPTPQGVLGWSSVNKGDFNAGGFGASGGNNMFDDWLDNIDAEDFGMGLTNMTGFMGNGAAPAWANNLDGGSTDMAGFMGNDAPAPAWLTGGQIGDGLGNLLETPMASSYLDTGSVFGDTGGWPVSAGETDWLDAVKKYGLAGAKMLFGGGAAAGAAGAGGGSGGGSGMSVWDSILRGLGGTDSNPYGGLISKGIASAPILAAINYAQNQGSPDLSALTNAGASIPTNFSTDISGLTSAMSRFNPEALTGQYDMATGDGRAQLAANLARRGVSGSSFGNSDISNFDMTRDVGRNQIIQGGNMQQAQIANQIAQLQQADQARSLQANALRSQNALAGINAQTAAQKNKFDLYGRSLLALGSVFSPQKTSLFG